MRFGRIIQLLEVLIVLGSLLVASDARAMTVAPMCDEVGASVAAPIPALPNATGELRAYNACDHPDDVLRAVPSSNGRASFERAFDPGQRAFGALFTWSPPPSATLPIAKPDRVPVALEHRRCIYRPPKA
jgi:hypothetical protein